ncbi:hypothetical protein SAMN05660236_4460 [Ohtaekwangia koreensis]|uniref:Transcription elongation factor, GreA/GreB, C-term n=1 Tax=Ohtaekwangia koreensis TaxID=688867 RepID=A0A1T5M5Z0_9BACT|nr:hypothetical protein SAMN05660236_4460 [Ohtaekwangia koreensis]
MRKKILDACVARQQILIDDFKERIKELTAGQQTNHDESYDQKDLAFNSMQTTEVNALNKELEFANAELDILRILHLSEDVARDHVAPGAVVVTNHHTFFISASLEKFTVDGHLYIGISTSSPLYKAMEGKTKGETFSYSHIAYKIKDIF